MRSVFNCYMLKAVQVYAAFTYSWWPVCFMWPQWKDSSTNFGTLSSLVTLLFNDVNLNEIMPKLIPPECDLRLINEFRGLKRKILVIQNQTHFCLNNNSSGWKGPSLFWIALLSKALSILDTNFIQKKALGPSVKGVI